MRRLDARMAMLTVNPTHDVQSIARHRVLYTTELRAERQRMRAGTTGQNFAARTGWFVAERGNGKLGTGSCSMSLFQILRLQPAVYHNRISCNALTPQQIMDSECAECQMAHIIGRFNGVARLT